MTATPAPYEADAATPWRVLHMASYAGLFIVGVYAAAFGPALEFIADDRGVSLDTAGLMLTAFFVGSISASAAVAAWLHGRDSRLLAIAGLALVALGTLVVAISPTFGGVLAGAVIFGLGDGLIVASLHILMANTSDDVPAAINHLNLYFAIGAVLGPLWAGAVLATTESYAIVYAGISALTLVPLGAMILAPSPGAAATIPDDERAFTFSPTTLVMGTVLFLYVGAEFGLGSWVSAYARETADAGVVGAALLASGYWAALMFGRIVSGAWFRRSSDARRLLLISAAGAGVASFALALSAGNIWLSAAFAFAAGFCMGPVWPCTVAIVAESGGNNNTAATVTMGNSGGVVLPWLQGRVLVGAGASQGVVVTSVLCAGMFVITALFRPRRV
jgi:fucose permease